MAKFKQSKSPPYKREPIHPSLIQDAEMELEIMDLQKKVSSLTAELNTATQRAVMAEIARQNWQQEAAQTKKKVLLWKTAAVLLAVALVISIVLH